MRPFRRFLPLALLSLCAACAQAEPPRPLLWKVSDANNSLYLLGSFHLLKEEDYPLAASTGAAFADAEALVFELPPSELNAPALAEKMQKAALRVDGTTLQQSLPPETWRKLEDFGKSRGMAITGLQGYESWFVTLVVSMVEMQRLGLKPELGLDRHFSTLAVNAGKPTAGLETGEQQIALFDGMSATQQLQLVQDTLEDMDKSEDRINELHALWRAGDAEALFAQTGGEMKAKYPQLYARLNSDRNRAWIPELRKRLDGASQDDTLVVVGAMHLLGEDGLVAALKAKGYTVERM